MRDFKEFMNDKIAVVFKSESEQLEFFELCEKHKMEWANGKKPKELRPDISFPVHNFFYNKHLGYSGDGIKCDTLAGIEIVPASEFLQPQTTIEIFQSKQTVVCLKKENGKVIARGVARCSKDDVFNFDYGSTIAFKRMLVDSKRKESMKDFVMPKSDHIQGDAVDAILPKIKKLKDGTKIIKQDKYEVGDKVLIEKKFVSGTQNDRGEMDKWLGKIMTVRASWNCTYRMIEDENELFGSGWSWNIKDIEGKVIK